MCRKSVERGAHKADEFRFRECSDDNVRVSQDSSSNILAKATLAYVVALVEIEEKFRADVGIDFDSIGWRFV